MIIHGREKDLKHWKIHHKVAISKQSLMLVCKLAYSAGKGRQFCEYILWPYWSNGLNYACV